jgi:hypothetical protein
MNKLTKALAAVSMSGTVAVLGFASPAHAANTASVAASDGFSNADCIAVGGTAEWVMAGNLRTNFAVDSAAVHCWISGGPKTSSIPLLGSDVVAVTVGAGTGNNQKLCVGVDVVYSGTAIGSPAPPWPSSYQNCAPI